MPAADPRYANHLRVMHACEKGATGVYWGHRIVSAIFYRDLLPKLSEMHRHELEHYAAFGKFMRARNVRTVIAPVFWCAGGVVYGALTALAGRRAIWRITAVVEAIVERELIEAGAFFKDRDQEVFQTIERILVEEVAHKLTAEVYSPGEQPIDKIVTTAAKAGAAVAKGLAKRL